MQRLQNSIQHYAWGSTTAIPSLLNEPPTGEPWAELWMGAHPRAPSRVTIETAEIDLNDALRRDPDNLLGREVRERFGDELPFLLKILAAAHPLSLQAHPSQEQARLGFAAENVAKIPLSHEKRNYKDAHHKPELICALSPFVALCGFRPWAQSLELIDQLRVDSLRQLAKQGLRSVLSHVMQADLASRRALSQALVHACAVRPVKAFQNECACIVKIGTDFPDDAGVVAALLLNWVRLEPGEALFLPAGNLHAYVQGVGIEIMANSDNVLRGGLTPKHVDVGELMKVLSFQDAAPTILRPRGAPEAIYETPAREFRLSMIDVIGPAISVLRPRAPDILWVASGEVTIKTKTSLVLRQGESIFVGASEGALHFEGRGRVFRATVGR